MKAQLLVLASLLSFSAQAQTMQNPTIAEAMAHGECQLRLTGRPVTVVRGYRDAKVTPELTLSMFWENYDKNVIVPTNSTFTIDKRQVIKGCLNLDGGNYRICSTTVDLVFTKISSIPAVTAGQFAVQCRRY